MKLFNNLGYIVVCSSFAMVGAAAPIVITYGGVSLISKGTQLSRGILSNDEENLKESISPSIIDNSVHYEIPPLEEKDYVTPNLE